MYGKKILFDYNWDVNKYKTNYDPEYWDLCRTFMEIHKTKYPEQKLAHLTEAFYQIGVYGSSYDAKTTRMVSALSEEVLEKYAETYPDALRHPFKKSAIVNPEVIDITNDDDSTIEDLSTSEQNQSSSRWDKPVDTSIIVNVLQPHHLQALFKGFVIIYDVKKSSAMNDDKVSILEESFRRSKFGPLHWDRNDTNNNISPIRLVLKWKSTVLAEAVGADEIMLRNRIAQAMLSKLSDFSHGIEAKWIYYREGKVPDMFYNPNPKSGGVYKVLCHSQFKGFVEIASYIDTFANSDSFVEIVFGTNFTSQEQSQIIEHVTKYWSKKLTYRTVSKTGAKSKNYSHVCIYHIRSGEVLKRWLDKSSGENERYRIVPPNGHRRAGTCDKNVREVLNITSGEANKKETQVKVAETSYNKYAELKRKEEEKKNQAEESKNRMEQKRKEEEEYKRKEAEKKRKEETEKKRKEETEKKRKEEAEKKRKEETEKKRKEEADKKRKEEAEKKRQVEEDKKRKEEMEKKRKEEADKKKNEGTVKQKEDSPSSNCEVYEDNLEQLLDGFVLFYDAKKNSEIDKDDWFSALCESFKISKFGPLEVVVENLQPMRMKCIFKWSNKILASAEGLTETQAKTAATLQLISKLEPFTYIIQAKEEYFYGGKVPPFVDNPDASKNHICRVVSRQDLPTYYAIFQTIDNFVMTKSHGEIVFGKDFTWELKNEIVVYIKAKGLDYRYFTVGDQKPWTHMAIYHIVSPEDLKHHLLSQGGENEKYKLIPPPKAELPIARPVEVDVRKEKVPGTSPSDTVANKRKHEEKVPTVKEADRNKIEIKLKKFKLDKVDFPEDTGGDFPGLILWVNIKKSSILQRSMFCILIDSFKMSKFGELQVEEEEETVWGRKEPLKKCVLKKNRKVLAVGLGETKTEAKNAASLQVLRQLRKHCYTIQSKESYFKEGKATPYDFEPEPGKEAVYRLAKRNKFKDRGSIINFVDIFCKTPCNHEVIFGQDFTCDEREAILHHCRQINLNCRLMKYQSTGKAAHSHIAIYHQKPLPTIKAQLMAGGGENDKYRLIPPGGKIPSLNSDNDMWPETLENISEGTNKAQATTSDSGSQEKLKNHPNSSSCSLNTPVSPKTTLIPTLITTDRDQPRETSKKKNLKIVPNQPKYVPAVLPPSAMSLNNPMNPQPLNLGIYPQGVQFADAPYGPQPEFITPNYAFGQQPHPDMPLSFGSQPVMFGHEQNNLVPIPAGISQIPPATPSMLVQQKGANYESAPNSSVPETLSQSKGVDLRDELSKKRQEEKGDKKSAERKVHILSSGSNVTKKDNEDQHAWSRNVFVNEPSISKDNKNGERSSDLRDQLNRKDLPRERLYRSEDNFNRKSSSNRHKIFDVRDRREKSPRGNYHKIPEKTHKRDLSRERFRSQVWEPEGNIRKREYSSFDRDTDDYSPAKHNRFLEYRDERQYHLPQRFRELWDNIPEDFALDIFMYKYVTQDSTTERDPICLLQATRSLKFNVDFDFITHEVARDEWQVFVELVTDNSNLHPLVGEGVASSIEEAKLIAAHHAVDTVQKACRVITPNYYYFADGGEPDFIKNGRPKKTRIYEIIQNMDPENPLDRYTVEVMFKVFLSSELEDLFFLASDFSYLERMLVVDMANQMSLWWRLFGPRHVNDMSNDTVSTQHVCVFKQKTALRLYRELLENNGSTEKYTLVEPQETRLVARESQSGRRHY